MNMERERVVYNLGVKVDLIIIIEIQYIKFIKLFIIFNKEIFIEILFCLDICFFREDGFWWLSVTRIEIKNWRVGL